MNLFQVEKSNVFKTNSLDSQQKRSLFDSAIADGETTRPTTFQHIVFNADAYVNECASELLDSIQAQYPALSLLQSLSSLNNYRDFQHLTPCIGYGVTAYSNGMWRNTAVSDSTFLMLQGVDVVPCTTDQASSQSPLEFVCSQLVWLTMDVTLQALRDSAMFRENGLFAFRKSDSDTRHTVFFFDNEVITSLGQYEASRRACADYYGVKDLPLWSTPVRMQMANIECNRLYEGALL
jgi:hypothetical protein